MVRYHRMKGRPTLWLPGTDHAGIATQVCYHTERLFILHEYIAFWSKLIHMILLSNTFGHAVSYFLFSLW